MGMMTLGELFPQELARVRAVRDAYRALGPGGACALAHIEPVIAEAEQALAAQDAVAMIQVQRRLAAIDALSGR